LKLGLHIAYWGLGLDAREQLSLVQEAERLGYSAVWVGEAYGSDAATVLAWLAAKTERIGLGSGVFQMPGRSPAMTAMTAATIDQLSGGRFHLGLGSSGPQVAEGWHGQRFSRQLARTREYVEVVRKALRRESLSYEGETITLPLPDGPGKALKLTIGPRQPRIPVYLAALGPKNTELVGAIADGWLPVLFSPGHVGEATRHLAAGAAGAGRRLSDVAITPIVYTSVDDDAERAQDALRPLLALYVGGMGSRERNFYNRVVCSYGFEAAARRVQDLYLAGRKEEATAALPAELLEAVCLCGTPDVVARQLALYAEAGVETLLVSPVAETVQGRLAQLNMFAAALPGDRLGCSAPAIDRVVS
jgi:F420-dependent oxidoreductase-like protein